MVVSQEVITPKVSTPSAGKSVVELRMAQANTAFAIGQGGNLPEGIDPTALRQKVYEAQAQLSSTVACDA